MMVKVVATPCLQWSQPSIPHSPHPSSKRAVNDVVSVCRNQFLGTTSSRLLRSHSAEFNTPRRSSHSNFRTACSASFDELSDAEFSREIHEFARRLQFPGVEDSSSMESKWPEIQPEPLDLSASVEMRANSVDLPVSMRMIKRKKKQWEEEFINGVGESAYCSLKKAFSSMVFIIRELHTFALQMRELLFYEDMQGILERVRREIHASFVWLFQQVFSHTPALMVHLMILLANFAVHSMSSSAAIAASAPPPAVEERETSTSGNSESSSIVKSCSASSSKTSTSAGGGNGSGSKTRPAPTGAEGDGSNTRPENLHRLISPETVLHPPLTKPEEEVMALWNSMVEEASRMQGEGRDEALLDHEMMQRFVSPVMAKMDTGEDHEEYHRTELIYQTALSQDPNNVLLLTNYAQFLYAVAHDYDRAEEYFKRAIRVEPKDAEAHSKYGNFLWQVKDDLWAAEETFLEAISADPSNSFYAANYAHFLWSTGGEDTCFPLDDGETIEG
ncbi:hypothetical protein Cgig2_031438 [Carnegiea gigantea]|uniref:Uncharacterized protein n=1 Tax=Carnegiea gigantea TaxID=171969 RepID=A0A9Q1QD95_9CARY|nr:hypothetical protein Cgig2_031438 [Carnegiea gigantea]